MRDIITVIDALLAVVPEGETPRARLLGLRESVSYTAPEVMPGRWRDLEAILVDLRSPYFGQPHPAWLTAALKIWRGEK